MQRPLGGAAARGSARFAHPTESAPPVATYISEGRSRSRGGANGPAGRPVHASASTRRRGRASDDLAGPVAIPSAALAPSLHEFNRSAFGIDGEMRDAFRF